MPATKRDKASSRADSLGAALYCALPNFTLSPSPTQFLNAPMPHVIPAFTPSSERPRTAGDEAWDAMYVRLCRYKEQHGDCLVPWRYEVDPQLGNWVKEQRKKNKNKRLAPERKQRLERLGFVWRVQHQKHNVEPWEVVFQRLCKYKEKHGNCLVPSNYKEDPKLGRWVSMQRFRQETLQPDRKALLASIGFV